MEAPGCLDYVRTIEECVMLSSRIKRKEESKKRDATVQSIYICMSNSLILSFMLSQ
jgi:hypothetical protein